MGLRFYTFPLSLLGMIWSWGIDIFLKSFLEVRTKLRRKMMLRIACSKESRRTVRGLG